jgi:hypothetical protein
MLILFINNTVVTMYIMLKSSVRKTDKYNFYMYSDIAKNVKVTDEM